MGDCAFDYQKICRIQHRQYWNNFFVEKTPEVNFLCLHCILNAYNDHNRQCWNLSDGFQSLQISWRPDKSKDFQKQVSDNIIT